MEPAVIRGLFPGPVGVGIVVTSGPVEAPREEAEALGANASEGRRRTFALGRLAARQAVAELGGPAEPIRVAPGGHPLWPAGIVGSITHTGDLGAAVAGESSRYHALGLDIEAAAREISPAAARHICTGAELEWADHGERSVRLLQLFTAKEAIFKAVYPIGETYLGFQDAELHWLDSAAVFTVTLRRNPGVKLPDGFGLAVTSRVESGFVLAGVAVPSPQTHAQP